MLGIAKLKRELTHYRQYSEQAHAVQAAIRAHMAVIEFTPTGDILDANRLFLQAVGYQLDDIVGAHHRLFCAPALTESLAYQTFWQQLQHGQSHRADAPTVII